MIKLIIFTAIYLLSLAVVYLVAYNTGYDDGEKIGRIDAMFESKGLTLKHNGEIVK